MGADFSFLALPEIHTQGVIYISVYISISVSTCLCTSLFMCIYVCIYTCTHIHICVYTHTHTHSIHKGISFSHKKGGNPAICDNIDELGGHDAEWNYPDRRTDTTWFHLHVECRIVKHIEKEGQTKVARGWGEEEMGRCWSKCTNSHLGKLSKFGR